MLFVLAFGGYWDNGSNAGLWYWNGEVPSSLFDPDAGGRYLNKKYVAYIIRGSCQKIFRKEGDLVGFSRNIVRKLKG